MSRGSGVGASHLKIHPAVKVIMPSAGLAAGHVTGPANGAPGWMAQCWACCSAGELAGVLLLPVSTPALPRHVGARHTVTQIVPVTLSDIGEGTLDTVKEWLMELRATAISDDDTEHISGWSLQC